jgi:hypothetical protein
LSRKPCSSKKRKNKTRAEKKNGLIAIFMIAHLLCLTPPNQGCQIFLGATYQNGEKSQNYN